MPLPLPHWRFSVDDYHRMVCAGILREDDRVELIDGQVVKMAPIGPEHTWSVIGLNRLFTSRFNDVCEVSVQNPVRLNEHNEPQPDFTLLRPRADYRFSLPTPSDVLLLIEVAQSSLDDDRRIKMPLYGQSGVPESWLIDLQHDLVHVYRDPTPDGYRLTQTLRRGERLAPLAFPDREIAVDELLV